MNYLTEKQLQALPTPRLLTLYRKRQIELSKSIYYTTQVDDPDIKIMEDYVALVKTILNTREHVPE